MILRTDAVVLRSMRYGETSRIVTLYTRERGKVAVLARGARTVKSRFGSTLEPLSLVEALVSMRPTRTLQTLREASHRVRLRLTDDLDKISAGLRIAELTNALTEDEEVHPRLFDLVASTLVGLDTLDPAAGERPSAALLYFELRLAHLIGFTPRFTRDAVLEVGDDGGVLRLETGEIEPLGLATGRRASRAALRAFATAARADLPVVLSMRLDPDTEAEAAALAEAYLRHHTDDAYPTRSAAVRAALAR